MIDTSALAVPERWIELDPRIRAMVPRAGRIVRVDEYAILERRTLTRSIELAVRGLDPLDELDRLVGAIADAGLEVVIDDGGIATKTAELAVRGHGEPRLDSYELRIQVIGEHDDVDLRAELERHPELAPFAAFAELSTFVTRVARSHVLGRPPCASVTVALDDETRCGVTAWLAAHELAPTGTSWKRTVGGLEHVVVFERSAELGVDEATAHVRAPSRSASGPVLRPIEADRMRDALAASALAGFARPSLQPRG